MAGRESSDSSTRHEWRATDDVLHLSERVLVHAGGCEGKRDVPQRWGARQNSSGDTLTSVLRADKSDEQTKTNTSTQRLDEGAYGGEVVSQGF